MKIKLKFPGNPSQPPWNVELSLGWAIILGVIAAVAVFGSMLPLETPW